MNNLISLSVCSVVCVTIAVKTNPQRMADGKWQMAKLGKAPLCVLIAGLT